VQMRLGPDSLLSGRAGDRLEAVAELISYDMRETGMSGSQEVLDRYSKVHGVNIYLFREDGVFLGQEEKEFPEALLAELEVKGNPRSGPRRPGRRPMRDMVTGGEGEEAVRPADTLFLIRTSSPTAYWAGVRATIRPPQALPPRSGILVIESRSLLGGGLFLDIKPLLATGVGVMALCTLFWLPLVRGMTGAVKKLTRATERISRGDFDARTGINRRDEFGVLGEAVDGMADRLKGYVTGQKRFLGDIAHELCSPIARMQMALAVVERNAVPEQEEYVRDIEEDLEHMSDMVQELLSFSKASLEEREIMLGPVNLSEVIEEVVEREAGGSVEIRSALDKDAAVLADEKLLARSLANLVRNAVKHASAAGPITVESRRHGEQCEICVSDCGDGVPEEALSQVFEPFYRPDAARAREAGGVGLGLAIVKTCVEACRGTVEARNRDEGGFEVTIRLAAAV
jgi:two-component system sensor histidine kinase CpxA